jgi:galactose mutarotase-like enzyme
VAVRIRLLTAIFSLTTVSEQHAKDMITHGSTIRRKPTSLEYRSSQRSLVFGECIALHIIPKSLSKLRSVDITTDQPATQVFTAFGLNTPRKVVHGGPLFNYTSFSAIALEQEGYIDAINNPEWGIDQICKFPHPDIVTGQYQMLT